MGHTRLGKLSSTGERAQVVALIEGGGGAAQLPTAAITAAECRLNPASEDRGPGETVCLLSRLPLPAGEESFDTALRSAGLDVSDSPGLLDVVGAVSEAFDRPVNTNGAVEPE